MMSRGTADPLARWLGWLRTLAHVPTGLESALHRFLQQGRVCGVGLATLCNVERMLIHGSNPNTRSHGVLVFAMP